MRGFWLAAAALFLASAMSAGCGGGNKQAVDSLAESYIASHEKRAETAMINQKLFVAAETNTDPSDYILGAGDLIQLSVFEAKDLNCEVRVSSRGFVTLPLLGQVEIKDLTAREAESKIEGLYRKTYIKDPRKRQSNPSFIFSVK